MEVEQKPFTRKRPQQLVYLELGSGNGGMLLSVSEEGFRFRAVSPVRADGPLPFAFSLDGINRLEGSGEIESLEDDGKSGGLRFTEVSDEFRTKLNQWLSSEAPDSFAGREVTPAAAVPLDTMENIRADIRAGSAVSLRYPQSATPVSAPPASVEPAHSEKNAPVIPARRIPERVIPDRPVRERAVAQPPANQLPVTESPVEPRPVAEMRPAVRPAAKAPIIDRIKPDPSLKPVFSERLPEPEETPNTASRLFPQAPPSSQEAEKPAALPSAFLKLARETKTPAGTPVAPTAPINSVPPAAQKLPAKSLSPVKSPASSALFTPAAPPASVVNVPPDEPPVTEQPRRYVPALDVSLDLAWENAKLSAPSEPPHLSRAAAGGIITIALAVILGALAFNFRQEIGTVFIQLGQRISGGNGAAAPTQEAAQQNQPGDAQNTTPVLPQREAQPQSAPADSGNTSKAASALPVTNGVGTPGGEASKKAAATNPGTVKSASSNPATETTKAVEKPQEIMPVENPADDAAKTGNPAVTGIGQEEFVAAREILQAKGAARDLRRAVDLLWASVRKGYVPAEVTLGDLYRRGDGVEKSCDQARVLLVAASKKGSPDARQQLEQMAEKGCE
jgi:hypothetical protein